MKLLETMAEKTQFEMKFPTMDTSSSKGIVTEAFDYHLTHDKVSSEIAASQRDNYVNLGCYALNVAEGL